MLVVVAVYDDMIESCCGSADDVDTAQTGCDDVMCDLMLLMMICIPTVFMMRL